MYRLERASRGEDEKMGWKRRIAWLRKGGLTARREIASSW
jgi:hypothetical protein